MQPTQETSPASPRIVKTAGEQLIFGPSRRYDAENKSAIPAQWGEFLPYLNHIPGQVGKTAYGVISNADHTGSFDYLCGVEVTEFPPEPVAFGRLRIAPQTYAVFEHREHISGLGATLDKIWKQDLPRSGYKAVHAPSLEVYGEQFNGATGLGGLEIWIPVEG